jgi:hypothetical protein
MFLTCIERSDNAGQEQILLGWWAGIEKTNLSNP